MLTYCYVYNYIFITYNNNNCYSPNQLMYASSRYIKPQKNNNACSQVHKSCIDGLPFTELQQWHNHHSSHSVILTHCSHSVIPTFREMQNTGYQTSPSAPTSRPQDKRWSYASSASPSHGSSSHGSRGSPSHGSRGSPSHGSPCRSRYSGKPRSSNCSLQVYM